MEKLKRKTDLVEQFMVIENEKIQDQKVLSGMNSTNI